MTEVRVTKAGDEDIEAVAAFFWDAWRMSGPDAPGWAGASESAMAELTAPELLADRIGGSGRSMFLAWIEDRVIGFAATLAQDEETVELAGIVVRQDLLGRGIGTPLLEAAVAAMTDAGAGRMVVRTESDNQRAIDFYVARGFTPGALVTEEVEGTALELRELSRTL